MQKRALVMSASEIAKDPRVLRQVEWLSSDGWSVDTVGWGEQPKNSNGRHFLVGSRPISVRLLAYLTVHGRRRYNLLVRQNLPKVTELGEGLYDLVLANDLDFLPWCVDVLCQSELVSQETKWHVDLHEYFGDQGHGVIWSLLFRRYNAWLFEFAKSDLWTTRSTVADGIADLYRDLAGFTGMKITQSAPNFSGLTPKLYEDDQIRLVYHGNADLARGLEALVSSVKNLDSRFELHLMLVGNARSIRKLKKIVAKENLSNRVYFPRPVAVSEIPKTINVYDLEVIFFPPVTKNLLLALPNKFFEAIQGAIGVVIGNSPSMRTIVEAEQMGLVVNGWKSSDLTTALNALDRATVNQYKQNAADAAGRLNSDIEGRLFLNEIANS